MTQGSIWTFLRSRLLSTEFLHSLVLARRIVIGLIGTVFYSPGVSR